MYHLEGMGNNPASHKPSGENPQEAEDTKVFWVKYVSR